MTLIKPIISSNVCDKLVFHVYITDKLRWKIGRQYHSGLTGGYNHPFWAFLQKKKFFFGWKDVKEVSEPFYPEEKYDNGYLNYWFFKKQVREKLTEVYENEKTTTI